LECTGQPSKEGGPTIPVVEVGVEPKEGFTSQSNMAIDG